MKKIILLPLLLVAAASPLFASQATPSSTSRVSPGSPSRFGRSAQGAHLGARDKSKELKAQEVRPGAENSPEALLSRCETLLRRSERVINALDAKRQQ